MPSRRPRVETPGQTIRKPPRWAPWCAAVLLIACIPNPGHSAPQTGQDRPDGSRQDTLTVERVEALKKEAEASASEDNREAVVQQYEQALKQLAEAARLRGQAESDKTETGELTNKVREAAEDLKRLERDDDGSVVRLNDLPSAPTSEQLTASLAERSDQRTVLVAERQQLEKRRDARSAARTNLLEKKRTLKERIETNTKELGAAPGTDPSELVRATRVFLEAERAALTAEGPAIESGLRLLEREEETDYSNLRLRVVELELARLDRETAKITELQAAKKKNEAALRTTRMRQRAEGINKLTQPALRARANETVELAKRLEKVTAAILTADADITAKRAQHEKVTGLEDKMRSRVGRSGLTDTIGLQLRRHKQMLPDTGAIMARRHEVQRLIRELESDRLQREDHLELVEAEPRPPESAGLARIVYDDHLNTLRTLLNDEERYFDRLSDLDDELQEVIKASDHFGEYIDARVLWIRSNDLLRITDVTDAVETLQQFLAPQRWLGVLEALRVDAVSKPLVWVAPLVLAAILILSQRSFRRELRAIGEKTEQSAFYFFQPTLRAALLTGFIAAPGPLLLGFFGWRLTAPPIGPLFSAAVGQGFIAAAWYLLLANLIRQACRPRGLALAHFDWSERATPLIRGRIQRLMLVFPVFFVVATLHTASDSQVDTALERLSFLVLMLALLWFASGPLHPRRGAFAEMLARTPNGWTYRLRWLWYSVALGLPVLLMVLTIFGYYFTASELSWRLGGMLWLIAGSIFLRALLIRWFVVSHRRLRIEQARHKRQVLREQADSDAPDPEVAVAELESEEAELQVVGQQTRRLINTGLLLTGVLGVWLLWVDVVPALNFLDRWHMWPSTREILVEKEQPDGTTEIEKQLVTRWITPRHLLLAAFFTVLTITASRNVPGMAEILLLQRLPLAPSIRYAIRTVTRYAILIVGVLLTSAAVGFTWAKVQWLVAALTVGLGFGLQEIFANFVSGLLILFERPIRIGDIVTIDGVSGTVTRIHIRATTVTDWDRKEYIVPNKEFVTGRVLNWTLTDKTSRIVITVGVAYGTDTEMARSMLLKVASDHEQILDDPAPLATFEGFGDSTLDLVLRCYMPSLDGRLNVISELHAEIDRRFAAAGIEIAFPQRDLNLRSVPPELVKETSHKRSSEDDAASSVFGQTSN